MEALVGKYPVSLASLVERSTMQAYDPKEDKFYCDLMCYVCDGWANKPCLLSGTICMRMMMAQCLGLRKMLSEFRAIGKWENTSVVVLDSRDSPPEYRRGGFRETSH